MVVVVVSAQAPVLSEIRPCPQETKPGLGMDRFVRRVLHFVFGNVPVYGIRIVIGIVIVDQRQRSQRGKYFAVVFRRFLLFQDLLAEKGRIPLEALVLERPKDVSDKPGRFRTRRLCLRLLLLAPGDYGLGVNHIRALVAPTISGLPLDVDDVGVDERP